MLSRRALLNVLGSNAEITQFFQNRPYTFVCLETNYEGKDYVGYGFSKVMWPDKWDDREGAKIANRHALIMVLHQIRAEERGHHRIETFDGLLKSVSTLHDIPMEDLMAESIADNYPSGAKEHN